VSKQEVTRNTYDHFGDVVLTVDPGQRQTAAVFDADGEMVQQVRAYGSPLPETTVTSFDAVGAVAQVIAGYGSRRRPRRRTSTTPRATSR
jgi:YD repeat-containing protein